MTLEVALDKTVKTVQRALNDLERNLSLLANYEEQQIDDSDFVRGVELEDSTCDLVQMLITLLSDLPLIAADIRGPCPSSQKIWWKEHKARRKAVATAEKERRRAAADAAKAATAEAEASQA